MTIVSRNPETLDGLQTYLQGANVDAQCAQTVDGVSEGIAPASRALLFFPDDFPDDAVDSALEEMRSRHPRLLTILVTATPKRFERHKTDALRPPIIITKPVWGWTILDAIHGRLEGNGPKEKPNR